MAQVAPPKARGGAPASAPPTSKQSATAQAQAQAAATQLSPEELMKDPKVKEQVEAAKTVVFHLMKGIKQIGMYRHMESKYAEYLQKATDALNAYCDKYGPLTFKVDVANFVIHKQELFNEESQIPYKIFKDGIRQIIFRPGFTVEEMVQFTLICLSDPDRGAEDLHAQFWKAQMSHFEFIMVEGFRMDEFSEEEIQVEVDKVVDYLQRRLRTHSEDYLRFARVSEEDLDAKLDHVDQMRGVVVTGLTATAELKARLQKDITEEENQRLFPKLISAVFQVVESGVDEPAMLEDMFVQLLDAMLLQEDFATINQVVLKLRAMAQRQGDDSAIGLILRSFLSKMGEEQRLSRVGDILKSAKLKSPNDIVRYLTGLDSFVVPNLLSVLETVEVPENRTLLCDVLVKYAKDVPEPFVNRLKSDRPQTIRDMIYVLDRSQHPDKLKFFGQALKSANLAIKLEVIGIISKGRTGEARKLIAGCLEDPNQQVRMTAARCLPEFDREKAYIDLLKLVKEEQFAKKTPEERQAMYAALGSTGAAGAISYFQQLLSTKSGLFNKQKVLDDKLMAVYGLAGAGTIQTYKLLGEIVQDTSQPPEVISAAKLQAHRTKRTLFGDKEPEA